MKFTTCLCTLRCLTRQWQILRMLTVKLSCNMCHSRSLQQSLQTPDQLWNKSLCTEGHIMKLSRNYFLSSFLPNKISDIKYKGCTEEGEGVLGWCPHQISIKKNIFSTQSYEMFYMIYPLDQISYWNWLMISTLECEERNKSIGCLNWDYKNQQD